MLARYEAIQRINKEKDYEDKLSKDLFIYFIRSLAMFINPVDYPFTFKTAHKCIVPPGRMVTELAGVAKCIGGKVPAPLQSLVDSVQCGVVGL